MTGDRVALAATPPLPLEPRATRSGGALRRASIAAMVLGGAGLAAFTVAAIVDVGGAGSAWVRLQTTVPAVAGVAAVAGGWLRGAGRTRSVRWWLLLALVSWALAELLRLAAPAGQATTIADLALVPVGAAAVAAFWRALQGRLGRSQEAAVVLDAAVIFLTVGSLLAVLLGERASQAPGGELQLAWSAALLGTAGAALVLDLSVHVERRFSGAAATLIGLLAVGLAHAWLVAAAGQVGWAPALLIGLGTLAFAHGAWTWSDREDSDPAYARLAMRLRAIVPLVAIGLTPFLLLATLAPADSAADERTRAVTIVAVVIVLVAVVARQSAMLLHLQRAVEREGVLADELRSAEETYRSMVERLPAVLYIAGFGDEAAWQYVSPHIEQLLGFSAEEWTADRGLWMRQIHPDDRARVLEDEQRNWRSSLEGTAANEYRMLTRDGREIWVRDEMVIIADADGNPAWWRGVMSDITEQKHAEQALRDSQEQTRHIIDTASLAYVAMSGDGTIIDWNRQAETTFGWSRDEAIGSRLSETVIPPTHREAHERGIRHYLATGESAILGERMEVVGQHRDGHTFPIELTVWPVRVADTVQFSALVHDITHRKELEAQLQHQAFHDSLTGLANRALFGDRVAHALQRMGRRPKAGLAVLFLDLDDFKTVNDSLGHAAGDQLLVAVAERMRGALRTEDTAARLGGDEFAVLLEETGRGGARRIGERLLNALRMPFELHGRQVVMRGSIGVTMTDDPEISAEELLRNADLAMYAAKARGKGRMEFFEPAMHHAAVHQLEMKADLENALAREQLEIHYQPIVDLRGGRLAGLEALVRWRHPERGLIAPDDFIGLAEETGIIVPLGRWVLTTACREFVGWRRELRANVAAHTVLSVNLSARQVQDPDLAGDVVRALKEAGLDATHLSLEITESAVMADLDESAAILQRLRDLGVQLAIDDFGTGYSSLSYLERLPVDILKIDRSFTAALGAGREIPVLVRSIIKLGHTLRLEVLAEGIERPDQLARLRELGCRLGQGYLFSPPVPAEEVPALLARDWPALLSA